MNSFYDLPDPIRIKELQEVSPELFDIMVKHWNEEQETMRNDRRRHVIETMELSRLTVDRNFRLQQNLQFFSFAFAGVLLYVCYRLLEAGKDAWGMAAIATTVLGPSILQLGSLLASNRNTRLELDKLKFNLEVTFAESENQERAKKKHGNAARDVTAHKTSKNIIASNPKAPK